MARTNSNEISSVVFDWHGRKGVRRRLSYRVSADNRGSYKKISESIQEYLDRVESLNSAATRSRYRACLEHFRRFLRTKHPKVLTLGQLNKGLYTEYQEWRRSGPLEHPKPPTFATINLELRYLRSWLYREGELGNLPLNPAYGIKKLRETDSKIGKALTLDEYERLIKASEWIEEHGPVSGQGQVSRKGFTDQIRFLVNTGLRISEYITLTWNDVDFENRLIRVQKKDGFVPKTFARTVPFSPESERILRDRYKQRGDDLTVFKSITKLRSRLWLLDCAKLAEIDGMTGPHNLRHTFVTWCLTRFKMDLATVQKLAGHKHVSTTQRYISVPESHIRSSMKSFLL